MAITITQPAPVTAQPITAQTFNQCMTECFAQMGEQTRNFVINTIKINIEQLIDSGKFDIDHYKQIINQLIILLDGDDQHEGFQKFVQLITDVNILKQEHITRQEVINITKNLFVTETVEVNNNFLINIAKNDTFINEIKNNTVIINSMINNVLTAIITYLSNNGGNGDATGDQFIALLSQYINNQIVIATNNFSKQINQVKVDVTNQFNVSIDNIQNNLTRISNEITRINTWINNCSTKDELASIRKELEIYNSLRIQFINLQSEVNELIKKCGDANFYANIDLSRNVTILNISSQLTTINQNIIELNGKISQCNEYVNKQDLANACAAACAIFVQTLTGSSK
jgi:hypothetical protein